MTSTGQDVTTWEGNDLTINADVGADITSATINYSLRRYVWDTGGEVTKATGGSGITITDAANGLFTIALADTDLDGLGGVDYYHECKVTTSGGLEYTAFTGTVTINRAAI